MVEIDGRYQGGLRCEAKHGPSGTTLQTDAPVDNHGRGESFSPTDLLATALGTCMITTMGIVAQQRAWKAKLDGATFHVVKEMTKHPPRRVERLSVSLTLPGAGLGPEDRKVLEHTAHNCPVRISLLPQIEVPLTIVWQD